tara:strand:- start:475 stop:642 length:168 start_codon:yes stop_codon:yes gene_type:complete
MLNSKRWEYYSTPSFKIPLRVLEVHHPKIKICYSGKDFSSPGYEYLIIGKEAGGE